MRTVTVNKHRLEVYDSIDDLPVKRFHLFNKYMLVDAGVGSDLNSINQHIARIKKFMAEDQPSAHKELDNLRQSLYLVSQGINVKHMSFVPLIKSINGKDLHDVSDENIKRISERLSAEKHTKLDQIIDSVKKKIDKELNLYFPSQFDSTAQKEYHDKLKQRALIQLRGIQEGKDTAEEIKELDDFLLTFTKPEIFYGKDSAEIKYDKEFEEMCLLLQKELSIDISKATVMEFYSSLALLKKINKSRHGNS